MFTVNFWVKRIDLLLELQISYNMYCNFSVTFQGTNICHVEKRNKIIFNNALGGDMLVSRRVFDTPRIETIH